MEPVGSSTSSAPQARTSSRRFSRSSGTMVMRNRACSTAGPQTSASRDTAAARWSENASLRLRAPGSPGGISGPRRPRPRRSRRVDRDTVPDERGVRASPESCPMPRATPCSTATGSKEVMTRC
ncbi:hypothetical protein ACFFX0_26505 [Citricoccus parietis]|uniref:Uncharacterized protein n=1 Tax=Citricoccus parietis TaxID=592307 RepID=A0ABV5G6J0_9MICC